MYYFMSLTSADNYNVTVWIHWSVIWDIHIHTVLCQTIIVHKALCNCYIATWTVHDIGILKQWKMRGLSKKSKKQWACLISKTILMKFDHSELLVLLNKLWDFLQSNDPKLFVGVSFEGRGMNMMMWKLWKSCRSASIYHGDQWILTGKKQHPELLASRAMSWSFRPCFNKGTIRPSMPISLV